MLEDRFLVWTTVLDIAVRVVMLGKNYCPSRVFGYSVLMEKARRGGGNWKKKM